MKKITIYTDGACSGNPGPGGWAAVLIHEKHQKEIFGSESNTTNNRMELMAAIKALEALKKPSHIDLYTDSRYVMDGITTWIKNWKKNNFNNGKIKNQDLWLRLDEVSSIHKIDWYWVKGHSDNELNNLVDKLARSSINNL